MQIQVKQSYKGKNISSLYRFPFVYSKRPNIGPADYWSLTLIAASQVFDGEQPIPVSYLVKLGVVLVASEPLSRRSILRAAATKTPDHRSLSPQ